MYLTVFAPLPVINAVRLGSLGMRARLKTLYRPELEIVLKPGKVYEIEKIDNPCFHSSAGEPWYVLKGTKRGLPCSEFNKRLRYSADCQLRVEISLLPPTMPKKLARRVFHEPRYVHVLMARVFIAASASP